MSANKSVVERYLAASVRSTAADLLHDDVEWTEWVDGVPGTGARTVGKAAVLRNFGGDELRSEVVRLTEEGNVVVAEGTVTVVKPEGQAFRVRFCNIFEIEQGRIRRLASYSALLKENA